MAGLLDYLTGWGAPPSPQTQAIRSDPRWIANTPSQLIPPSNSPADPRNATQLTTLPPPAPRDAPAGMLAPAPAMPTGYGLGATVGRGLQAFMAGQPGFASSGVAGAMDSSQSPAANATSNFARGLVGAAPYVPPPTPVAVPNIQPTAPQGTPVVSPPAPAVTRAVSPSAPAAPAARQLPSFGPLSIMQLQALTGLVPRQPMPQEYAQQDILQQLTRQRDVDLQKAAGDPDKVREAIARHDQALSRYFISPQLNLLQGLQSEGQQNSYPGGL